MNQSKPILHQDVVLCVKPNGDIRLLSNYGTLVDEIDVDLTLTEDHLGYEKFASPKGSVVMVDISTQWVREPSTEHCTPGETDINITIANERVLLMLPAEPTYHEVAMKREGYWEWLHEITTNLYDKKVMIRTRHQNEVALIFLQGHTGEAAATAYLEHLDDLSREWDGSE